MRRFVIIGLFTAIGIALLLSPFASQSPDGLEKVAEEKGFLEKGEQTPVNPAPAAGYAIPGIKNQWMSNSIAGVTGTLLAFGLAYGLAQLLSRRKREKALR